MLIPGASQNYTYVYQASGSGLLNFSAQADSLGYYSAITTSPSVLVQVPPSLSVTAVTLAPLNVILGQQYTMVVTVSHTGGANATGVVPNPPVKTGNTTPNALSGPFPSSAALTPGQSTTFTYTGTVTISAAPLLEPWNLGYSVSAKGFDANSGVQVNAASAFSNTIAVRSPANLAASLAITPTLVNRDETVQVVMTVLNSGGVAANNVDPDTLLQGISDTGGLSQVGPDPVTKTIVAKVGATPGSATFTWTFSAVGSGFATLRGGATGTDSSSGGSVSAPVVTSNTITIEEPVQLAVTSLIASPASAGTGSPITVVMTVQNVGQATALNVSGVAGLTVTPVGMALINTPPLTVASLAGGASASFTWIYDATSSTTGPVSFSGNATALDSNDGLTRTSAVAGSNVINIFAQGSVKIDSISFIPAAVPLTVSAGQQITVLVTVSNTGQGNSINVAPVQPA